MATTNDETNAPMLAINRRLGYRPFGRRVEYLRGDLPDAQGASGKRFFASAASTCEVTHTGVTA
jgi:hypothetical protein